MREIATEAPALPAGLSARLAGYRWRRDTVGEAGAAVYRLHAPGRADVYLKHGTGAVAQDVVDEMTRLRWLQRRMPVPELRAFVATADAAWLLTTALPGRTAYQVMTDDPAARMSTAAAIARFLAAWHRLPVDDCPFEAGHRLRMRQAEARMLAGVVDTEDFGDAHAGWSAEQVWDRMATLVAAAPDRVVTHGDFSLDNILIADGRVAGCIDFGRVGVADRYQDIAILWDCLAEFGPDVQAVLAPAYGLPTFDRRRLDFHLCLDEFF